MVYIEKRRIGKKDYYYIVKNSRAEAGKWKKTRKYAGEREPSEDEVKTFSEKIGPKTRVKYLTKDQISLLNGIKTTVYEKNKAVDREDTEIYHLVDDAREAYEEIKKLSKAKNLFD